LIKRINQIQNIGAFREFSNGGSVQFEKMTFIYGLNTRGKTTLAEIFSSLSDDNPSLITDRESIPEITSRQNVTMSIKPDDNGSEQLCIYKNGHWEQGVSQDNLHIFGSDFIHKHLFTGLSVQRQNKENLTQFILGQEGVELASTIAEDKRLLRQKKSTINKLVPLHVQNKPEEEINAFIEIDHNKIDLEGSQQELANKQTKLKQEQERLKKPSEILAIQDFPDFIIPNNKVQELIERTKSLFRREYSDISESALEYIKNHINRNFEIKDNAERWIKDGLDNINEAANNCSFCGQSLSNAADLIEAYHSYFNKAYRNYISEVSNEIAQLKDEWQGISLNSIGGIFRNKTILTKYQQEISSSEFDELVSDFEKIAEIQIENDLNENIKALSEQLKEYFNAKERKPHESIEPSNFSEIISFITSYFSMLEKLEEIVKTIRIAIKEFKDSYLDQKEIQSRIEQLNIEIDTLKKNIARVEQNEECESYLEAKRELKTIVERISTNEENLSQNQSHYLENFYNKINYYFQRFGSEHFTLERETDNRGHQPVYYLRVKYRDVKIDESNFKSVFSESDKRALALSVFWAKISLLDEDQKSKAIIVLDDPITSFDDNRIRLSLNIIKDALRYVRQIVILTHYTHFIRSFCEQSMNDYFTPAFVEIDQNRSTSLLKKINKSVFVETTYERMFKKIISFINKESNEDIRHTLRPFLESQYIPHFYINKLREARDRGISCGTLEEKIEAIFADNDEVKRKFHEFRTSLNPDAHIFTCSNDEDVRGFACDMMNYLYNFSYDSF
jgi:wobble nucleotide-excising tRNase